MHVNPRNFRFLLDGIRTGVLQNVGHTTSQVRIAVAGGGAEADDYFNGWGYLVLLDGPAAGEYRRIIDFATATDDMIVDPPFSAVPGADNYAIYTIFTGDPVVGTAVTGGPDSITLQLKEGIRSDFWAGCDIDLVGGTGGNVHYPAQRCQIVNYDGASQVAKVNRKWRAGGVPDGTTKYRISGHLYLPCKGLEVFPDAGLIRVSDKPLGLAHGVYNLADHYGDPTGNLLYVLLELAGEAGQVTLNMHRYE